MAQVVVDLLQVFQRQTSAGLAKGAGVGIQFGGLRQAIVVGLNAPDGLAARAPRIKDLGEEGPKVRSSG